MNDIRHSSATPVWLTSPDVVWRAHKVFGGRPGLDPATSPSHNVLMQARSILTEADDGLFASWHCVDQSVWLNPPGGKLNAKSLPGLFWARLLEHRHQFDHAIFMGFTLEILRTSQNYAEHGAAEFTHVIPCKRLRFWTEDLQPGKSPSHANVIIYVPGRRDATPLFDRAFRGLGTMVDRTPPVL